jgi:hypothetical protein
MKIGSPRLRRNLGIGAVAIVVATWLAVVAVMFLLPFDRTRFVVMWAAAVLMTEALFWVAMAIGGITALNRFQALAPQARLVCERGSGRHGLTDSYGVFGAGFRAANLPS